MWIFSKKTKKSEVEKSSGNPMELDGRMFRNEMELYAYYLELELKFKWYEDLDEQGRKELADEVKAANDDEGKREEAGGPNVIVCRTCRFNCGTTPCSCESLYNILIKLRKRYENRFIQDPHHLLDTIHFVIDELTISHMLAENPQYSGLVKFLDFPKGV